MHSLSLSATCSMIKEVSKSLLDFSLVFARDNKCLPFSWWEGWICVCMCIRVREKERWLASYSRKHLTFAVSPQVFVFRELTLIKIASFNAFPRTIEYASSIRLSDFLLLIGAIRVGCLAVETEQNCSSALGKAQCTKCVLIMSFTAPARLQTEEEMEFSQNIWNNKERVI